jgi:hypothetical protein
MTSYQAYSTGSTAANNVWYTWNTNNQTGTSATGTDGVWGIWIDGSITANSAPCVVDGYNRPVVQDIRTPEQIAEADRQQTAALETARMENQRRVAVEAEAAKKAEQLLVANLNPTQKKRWKEAQEFVVLSQSGRRFVITNGRNGNVREVDDQGNRLRSFCIVSPSVPVPDQLLAQKLMLECAEADFLRIANNIQ